MAVACVEKNFHTGNGAEKGTLLGSFRRSVKERRTPPFTASNPAGRISARSWPASVGTPTAARSSWSRGPIAMTSAAWIREGRRSGADPGRRRTVPAPALAHNRPPRPSATRAVAMHPHAVDEQQARPVLLVLQGAEHRRAVATEQEREASAATRGAHRLDDPGSVSLSPVQPCFRRPGRPVVPADRHARRDQRDSADKIEPALAAEPIEKTEATEATEPIERTDPAEPMHRIEPAEPMDKIDPLDPRLRSEPAEPADRGEISVFAMREFSHPLPISGR